MGRWRRNKNYKRKKDAASTGQDPLWTWKERHELIRYLKAYKKGAEQVYHDGRLNDVSDGEAQTIGKVEFPPLTKTVLSQPFLELPQDLTSKQRKIVHECCVEVDLFHAGVGKIRDDRYLVVSIYADGFDYVDDLEKPNTLDLYRYRPWYCHNSSSESNDKLSMQQSAEKQGRRHVSSLIDQPGDCLRDDRDELDFEYWQDQDLSTVEPPDNDDSNWMLVDSAGKMKQCVQELQGAKEIAFDLESYNKSKFTQLTCLLQIASDLGKEYVIDTLAPGVWDEIHALAPLFADPSIVKVAHSIGGLDIRSLHRDFGIFVVNAFDTYEAAKVLKLDNHGLAAVCQLYGLQRSEFYVELKRVYQASDWRIRPLTDPMIQYGRYDVHFLLRLRWLMIRDLVRHDLWDKNATDQAEEARIASESLAAMLKQVEDAEDGAEQSMLIEEEDDDFQSTAMTLPSRANSEKTMDDSYHTPSPGPSLSASLTDLTIEEEGPGCPPSPMASAAKLRLQPMLMKVISLSQERCLDLWSCKVEPHLKNSVFTTMLQREKRTEVNWTAQNTLLYDELVKWRDRVAARAECLPGFVAQLDLLVQIAVKRPVTLAGLRRISYYLPELIEGHAEYREEVLTIVRQSRKSDGMETTSDGIYYYADQKQSTRSTANSGPAWNSELVWKVGLSVAIGAGIAFTILAYRRRRR